MATAERAGRYSQIPRHCSACGELETDSHLFLHCNLPTQVWISFTPPISTRNIPPEDEGIQQSLLHLIPQHATEDTLVRTLFTLWYIWKARNNLHFNRKQWTPSQVHQAAQSHINNHYLAALPTAPGATSCTPARLQPQHQHATNIRISYNPQQVNNYTIDTLACLQGTRCYIDASTEADNTYAGTT